MHTGSRPVTYFCLRSLVVSALFVSAIALITEVKPRAFVSKAAAAAASNTAERDPFPARGLKPTYRWNLSDAELPLISLPDQIGGSLDLSLAYSMDQFEFPLFQSLYYNKRAGKYILMVISKETLSRPGKVGGVVESHAEFIDLSRVDGRNQFAASGKTSLRLIDNGYFKLLKTTDGTVYTFATFGDGELHCSQIKDRGGVVLDLKYTGDSAIQTIADGLGRSVNFSYTDQYVSAITQTWAINSQKTTRTWAIAEQVRYAHRRVSYASASGPELAKRIPSNATSQSYGQAMIRSDALLASTFGGPGAIAAANGFEPTRLGSQYPLYRGDLISDEGRLLRGHLSFAMHLYGSSDGTGDTALYVPSGFTAHSDEPGPSDAVVTFYYPRLGNLSDVTLAVFHVANFHLSHEGGRVRIGNIGGRGGSITSYKHSHLEFYRGNTGLPTLAARTNLRIDPARVFASTVAARH